MNIESENKDALSGSLLASGNSPPANPDGYNGSPLAAFQVGETANMLIIRHEKCTSLGLLAKAVKEQEIQFRYLDTVKGEILNETL